MIPSTCPHTSPSVKDCQAHLLVEHIPCLGCPRGSFWYRSTIIAQQRRRADAYAKGGR